MSDEALKRCPFCASANIGLSSNGEDFHHALCLECGGEGPSGGTEAEAIAAWNRRVPLPDVRERAERAAESVWGEFANNLTRPSGERLLVLADIIECAFTGEQEDAQP